MTAHEAIAAIPIAGTPNRALAQSLLVGRYTYVLADNEVPQDFVPTNASGDIVPVIVWQGIQFYFDPLDTTSAHDGTTVLVTADGKRYAINGVDLNVNAVFDKDQTVPPVGSPSIELGDAYLVPAGAGGDWADHTDDVAVYTARGWVFIAPRVGRMLYVRDEDTHYTYRESGIWGPGFGNNALSAKSVRQSHQLQGNPWIVENQTTNTPPTVSQDVAYIIGSAPTGAWAGHAGKIAVREELGSGSTFTIYTPREGELSFDKSAGNLYVFRSGVWQSAGGVIVARASIKTASGSATFRGASASYTYSATTPPDQSANLGLADDAHLTHTARKVGAKLVFSYQGLLTATGGASCNAVALFRDGDAVAVDYIGWSSLHAVIARFEIAAADTSSHNYRVHFITTNGGTAFGGVTRRLLEVMEMA